MAGKKQVIKQVSKTKKLSGREIAALIIGSHVAEMRGEKPTLTANEKVRLKASLEGREHEAIAFNAWIDTFALTEITEDKAIIAALKASSLLEKIRSLALKYAVARAFDFSMMPTLMTKKQLEEAKEKDRKHLLSHPETLAHVIASRARQIAEEEDKILDIDDPYDIHETHPHFFKRGLENVIKLIQEGKLAVCSPTEEMKDQLSEWQEKKEKVADIALLNSFDPDQFEPFNEAIEALDYIEEKYSEHPVDPALLTPILEKYQAGVEDEKEYFEALEDYYCTGQALYDCQLPEWTSYIDEASGDRGFHSVPFYTAILADEQPFDQTAEELAEDASKHEKRLKRLLHVEINHWKSTEKFFGIKFATMLQKWIIGASEHIMMFYSIKAALAEIEALLEVQIARELRQVGKSLEHDIEAYNGLAQMDEKEAQAKYPFNYNISPEARLPVINIQDLQPTEEQIAKYRSRLEKHLGSGWINFALNELSSEKREEIQKKRIVSFSSNIEEGEEDKLAEALAEVDKRLTLREVIIKTEETDPDALAEDIIQQMNDSKEEDEMLAMLTIAIKKDNPDPGEEELLISEVKKRLRSKQKDIDMRPLHIYFTSSKEEEDQA